MLRCVYIIFLINSSLQIGGKCLARYTDGLWCNVKIEGIEEDGRFVVAFEGRNDVLVVDSDEIMPAGEYFITDHNTSLNSVFIIVIEP